jgi:PKD repeat protein
MKTFFQKFAVAVLCMSCTYSWAQCAAGFSVVAGTAGSYTFLNTSTGTSTNTNYTYSFGNFASGYVTSSNPNPTQTFSTNGTYSVSLSIADSSNGCFASAFQTITVTSAGCNASLVINNTNLPSGGINLTHNMSGIANITNWTFGDGGSGSGQFATHTYSASGVYVVNATVSISGGLCTYSASKTISVNVAPCGLNAAFTYTVGSSGNVNFQSTSTGTSSQTVHYWYFGDGGNGSGPNPSHSYMMNGTYPVLLSLTDSISNFVCTDATTIVITVTNVPCPNLTNFTMAKDSSQTLTWNAYPQYPSNISSATWSWGDGSSTTGLFPSHTYSAAGVYSVCLSAMVTCGTNTITCVSSSIYKGGEGAGMITLNVIDVAKITGLRPIEKNSGIRVFPNPSTGMLSIILPEQLNASGYNLKIYDSQGKNVSSAKINTSGPLDVSSLADGLYLLKLDNGTTVYSDRLVIKK